MSHLFPPHIHAQRRRSRSDSGEFADLTTTTVPLPGKHGSTRVSTVMMDSPRKRKAPTPTTTPTVRPHSRSPSSSISTHPSSIHRRQESPPLSLPLPPPPPLLQQQQQQQQQQQLPVYAYQEEILRTVLGDDNNNNDHNNRNNRITLITAATGSGKSTQIPTFFLSRVPRKIAVTQPRRVAAMTLAQRVIFEQPQPQLKQPQQIKQQQSSSKVSHAPVSAQQLIGYRVRFQDTTNVHTTKLVYITDGMLLRDAMIDPLLLQYSIIFLDEAHERSLPTDIVMSIVKSAYLKRRRRHQQPHDQHSSSVTGVVSDQNHAGTIQASPRHKPWLLYPPLYVVVMSATLQIQTFVQYFGGTDQVQVIDIPGRQFPVQILYTAVPQDDYMESTLATILQIHDSDQTTTTDFTTKHSNGDILVFLPGQEEIESMVLLLKQQLQGRDRSRTARMADQTNIWTGDRVEVIRHDDNDHHHNTKTSSNSSHDVIIVAGVMICVLYAALPPEAQLNAFLDKPAGCRRKVILATNIAETSITIPSIKYVIDPGKYKCRYMMSHSNTGMECLSIADISQAQAAQRSGRAGRVEAGICFRLYTETAFEQLDETSVPEILRVNLSQVILQLKGMGVHDPTTFDFVTPPNSESIVRAMKVLYALSALDNDMTITEYGKKLAKLPLDPMYGHLLLQSVDYTCLKDMLTTVAVLSVENLLYRPSTNSADGATSTSTNNMSSSKATAAHKRFVSHEGDIPTYLNVYNAWRAEAVYVPPTSGGRKAQKKMLQRQQMQDAGESPTNHVGRDRMQLHGEWCQQNFVSGRSLARAFSVRLQLEHLCERSTAQNGLGLDVNTSYGQDRERFLKCIASGLFLQAASRIQIENPNDDHSKGRSGQIVSSRGRYQTKVGNVKVSVHPTSSMFNRQPAPKCVVYTELVVTKKSYIRGVTQIREEWLTDVAPNFYRN